jgi:hypothetical protein
MGDIADDHRYEVDAASRLPPADAVERRAIYPFGDGRRRSSDLIGAADVVAG